MDVELTDIEFEVLNTLYFAEPFEHILEECSEKPAVVADVLKQLIHKKFVAPMRWDEEKGDYVHSFMYDSDDMHAYHYVATRAGLTAHNSR